MKQNRGHALPDRSEASGRTTPERLIEAVERLVTEGEGEPSLRDITFAAGANVAAVNYHFGSKEALLDAVVERALAEHAREQLAELEAVAGSQPPPGIDEIVRAWMSPYLVAFVNGRPTLMTRVVAKATSGGSLSLRRRLTAASSKGRTRFLELLSDRLPGVSIEELDVRISLASRVIAEVFARCFDDASSGEYLAGGESQLVERAVAFMVGGLTAPGNGPAGAGPP
jgi:AcrR family transcriptional regulator